jgi:hypothetical protein
MEDPFNRMILLLCGASLIAGGVTFTYREQLRSDAHWITKILCDDMPGLFGEL